MWAYVIFGLTWGRRDELYILQVLGDKIVFEYSVRCAKRIFHDSWIRDVQEKLLLSRQEAFLGVSQLF